MIARVALSLVLLFGCASADATMYRCDAEGRVTYGDMPCPSGSRATTLARERPVDAPDRAIAEARAERDRRALAAAEKERDREEHASAAMRARQADAARRHQAQCAKLALRSKRASEDALAKNGRDDTKAKTRAKRAAEDQARECRVV